MDGKDFNANNLTQIDGVPKEGNILAILKERAQEVRREMADLQEKVRRISEIDLGREILSERVSIYPVRAMFEGREVEPILLVQILEENEEVSKELVIGTQHANLGGAKNDFSKEEQNQIRDMTEKDYFYYDVGGE